MKKVTEQVKVITVEMQGFAPLRVVCLSMQEAFEVMGTNMEAGQVITISCIEMSPSRLAEILTAPHLALTPAQAVYLKTVQNGKKDN